MSVYTSSDIITRIKCELYYYKIKCCEHIPRVYLSTVNACIGRILILYFFRNKNMKNFELN